MIIVAEILKKKKPTKRRVSDDYRHPVEFRALSEDEKPEDLKEEMVVEGRAIVFEDKIRLFEMDGEDYYEVIHRGALDKTIMKDVPFKYNHSDYHMVLARTRNDTLRFDVRDDGMYIRAVLADTTAGRDMYTLIKRGDINKMSFAFVDDDVQFEEETRTFHVNSIKRIFDVSAVDFPAYENTDIFARRKADLEKRQADLERLEARRKRLKIKLKSKKRSDS